MVARYPLRIFGTLSPRRAYGLGGRRGLQQRVVAVLEATFWRDLRSSSERCDLFKLNVNLVAQPITLYDFIK